MVRFFDYSQFHGKNEAVGSTYIRVDQLIKYWPEAQKYKYGELPSTMIFQKVFCSDDYKFPKHLESKKILDICDPMWLEGMSVVETAQAMDAVVTPTESLAEFMRQFHSKVVVIPDRFDLEKIPKPKQPKGDAKTVVWFGYAHNSDCLKYAMPAIDRMGLNLLVISNDDPMVHRWSIRNYQDFYKYKKYDEDIIYNLLQTADYAVLPADNRPVDHFKSNNKTIKANLAGLPVATTSDEMELYNDPSNRQDWFNHNYDIIAKEYDVRNSVKEYKDLIEEICQS